MRRFAAMITASLGCCAAVSTTAAQADFDVLVFSRTAGFRHASIPDGVACVQELGREHGFGVAHTEDPSWFTDERLASYGAVVFLSTTGNVLDDDQQGAFERYIRAGGGYVGIHAASDTEYEWPWYGKLVGAYFKSHPAVQDATILVTDRAHPSTSHLPPRWQRRDEWYDYRDNPRGRVHVLAALDERTYDGGKMGRDHPIAWCHEFDGGRAWYTGGGHTSESFDEPAFRRHIVGGIRWAAGQVDGEAGATIDAYYDKVVLDDFVTDPMELCVASDGRVIFVERAGVVKIWKPASRQTVVAGFVDVYGELEDGLLGVTLDPGFDDNGWVYLYYAPAGDEPKNVLARWTLDGDTLVDGSERVLLEVATQREECCHSGGSLAFDADGHLYVSTGDNTSPFASSGFTPIDERPGRGPFDAQKSSGNTHDLRGKILRIRPTPDGGYEIPDGNLFPADGSQGRPEIFVMGCRNPFRISFDDETGTLYWGDVGPDAGAPSATRGPAGQDEFNRTRVAGNFGWPYFIGDNKVYHDYDFDTNVAGAAFDPQRPVNESPNNTGNRELPSARPAWIWYAYGESAEFPGVGTGGRCAMAGPTYHAERATGRHRLPAH
ncbi:MAG: ThuA domain-containing protein, partial [Planctomycetota bacterium]